MSFGIAEVISLLMGLSGFGLQANPKAPTANQALEYAVPDADLVAHFDAASVVPGNYRLLTRLADQPQVRRSPELVRVVKKVVAEVQGPLAVARTMTGIDLTSDVWDATAFVQYVPNAEPNMLVAVHGHFVPATIDKIGRLTGKQATHAGAAAWVDAGDGNAVALTGDGVLLVGTKALVQARVASTWHAPSHVAGTTLGYAADILDDKPVFAAVVTMSQAARTKALAKLGGKNFGTDLIARHRAAAFAIYHDGVGWLWVDNRRSGLDAMAQISDGLVDLLRASQIAPRGFAKIVFGGLESYRGKDKHVDAVLRHKAALQRLIADYTGDGTFKVEMNKNPRSLRLDVRLRGKNVSDVLPVGMMLPMGAAGFLLYSGEAEAAPPPMMMPAPPPPSRTGKRPGRHR